MALQGVEILLYHLSYQNLKFMKWKKEQKMAPKAFLNGKEWFYLLVVACSHCWSGLFKLIDRWFDGSFLVLLDEDESCWSFSSRTAVRFTSVFVSETSQQLSDGLPWNLVQTLMLPSGWIVSWYQTFHPVWPECQHFLLFQILKKNASMSTDDIGLGRQPNTV